MDSAGTRDPKIWITTTHYRLEAVPCNLSANQSRAASRLHLASFRMRHASAGGSDGADRVTRLEKSEHLGSNPTPAACSRSDYRVATRTSRYMSTFEWYTCNPAAGPRFRIASTEDRHCVVRRGKRMQDNARGIFSHEPPR